MVVKTTEDTWVVVAEDVGVTNFTRRAGYKQNIHGFVRWTGSGFQVYFSHVTQQSPDRSVRKQPPMVVPVPLNEVTSPAVRACIMAEFCQILFLPEVLSAESLPSRGLSSENRAEMGDVLRQLQAEMDSVDETTGVEDA